MNYLQTWLTSRIVDTLSTSVLRPSEKALHSPNSPEHDYVVMRTQYGLRHHWPLDENGVDIDLYDHDPHTRLFLAFEHSKFSKAKINAGMRLTKVKAFEKSLSFSMWSHAIDKPNVIAQLLENKNEIQVLKEAAHAGKLWDLTRLVTAMSLYEPHLRTKQTKRATYAALLLLLGSAIRHTGKDSYWFFTTNNEVKHFLDRLGIEYSLLAKGRISYSDTGESYFAWSSVNEAFQKLKQGQPVIADLIQRGYDITRQE